MKNIMVIMNDDFERIYSDVIAYFGIISQNLL